MSKPEGMSDDDDPAALAKRFLDLWQEEIAGAGRDEGPGALTLRLAALHLAALAPDAASDSLNGRAGDNTSGAEAPPPSSGDGAQRLAELARRLAACEEGIAALEARARGAGSGPRKGTRRDRS